MSELVLEKNAQNLPQGWVLGKIQDVVPNPKIDIVDGPFGSNLKATEYVNHGIPIMRLQNVDRYQFINKNIRYVTKEKAEQLKRHSFSKNDIVITKLGDPVGKACLVPEYLENGIIVADILRMRILDKFVSRKFLMYLLNSEIIIKQFANHTRGTTRPRVNLTKFRDFSIPIPPLNEQKRIVAKIEELFSKLDFAKQTLEKTKTLLKQYKQSLLKHAFEGKLTEKWREENKDKLEPASVLMEKIRKIKENKKIKKMNLIPLDSLYKLPDEWIWDNVFSIANVQTGPFGTQLHKSDYTDSGVPVIEIGDVHPYRNLSEGSAHYVSKEKATHLTRFAVKQNDILFTRVGTVGRCTVVPDDCTGWLMSTSLIRVRILDDLFNSKFLFYYFISPIASHFTEITSKGTTRMGTNSKIVSNLPIIIASKDEQKLIVAKIEEGFSLIENNEKIIDLSLKNIEGLKNGILKQAFEGKLVPQDPNDEPAEVLLERIKQEKQKIIKETKPRRKKNDK